MARVFAEAAANTLFLVQVGAAALPYLCLYIVADGRVRDAAELHARLEAI